MQANVLSIDPETLGNTFYGVFLDGVIPKFGQAIGAGTAYLCKSRGMPVRSRKLRPAFCVYQGHAAIIWPTSFHWNHLCPTASPYCINTFCPSRR